MHAISSGLLFVIFITGQCDAFLSYLTAKLYKDWDILVGSELFSFILWFILKDHGSPEEYSLSFLEKIIVECREKSWATDWARLTMSHVLHDLPPSINCQNKMCLIRSVAATFSSSDQVSIVPDKSQMVKPERVAPPMRKSVSQPLYSRSGRLFDQEHRPSVVHSLSIDSLSGALANTQLKKSNYLPGTVVTESAPGHILSEPTNIPSAKEMSLMMSKQSPIRPAVLKTSNVNSGIKQEIAEIGSITRTPLSDAVDILYRTGKRNLRRYVGQTHWVRCKCLERK